MALPTTNLVMHYLASDLLLANGAGVATWTSHGSLGPSMAYDATKEQPIYHSDSPGSVHFQNDGSVYVGGSAGSITGATALNGAAGAGIFVLAKFDQTVGTSGYRRGMFMMCSGSSSTNKRLAFSTVADSATLALVAVRSDGSTTYEFDGGAVIGGAWHRYGGTLQWSTRTFRIYVDGTMAAESTTTGTTGTYSATDSYGAGIGNWRWEANDNSAWGDIACVLVYNAVPSTQDLADIDAYLAGLVSGGGGGGSVAWDYHVIQG